MQIYHEQISDVTRYIDRHRHIALEHKRPDYEKYLRHIRKFHKVDPTTNILEIGTGTGWFPLLCKANGLRCKGLEISPQLVEYAKELGAQNGIEPDIELGNIEDTDLGDNRYDVIVAMSVFEHVEHWEVGLRKLFKALKPGGLMLFESTNKFSFTSGEYPEFPLYGWLPDALRYKLRSAVHGPDIMHLGIDFNQFRYPMLRKELRKVGFREIYDRLALVEPERIQSPIKRMGAKFCRDFRPLGMVVLTFMPTTNFACIK